MSGLLEIVFPAELGEQVALDGALEDAEAAVHLGAEHQQAGAAGGEIQGVGTHGEPGGLERDGLGGCQDGDARVGGEVHGDGAAGEARLRFLQRGGEGGGEDPGVGVTGRATHARWSCGSRWEI